MEIVDRSQYLRGGRVGFLLIHGLGGTPVELRFVAQGLARAGYTVSCPQLAGHCGTEDDLRRSKWTEWYRSVEKAHDRIKADCDIVIAGGLSMGGLLALHLARNRPDDVHGLSLYAPTLKLDGWSVPWYGIFLRLLWPSPLKTNLRITEREPYGIKDERVRKFVVQHMTSGDSTEAGVFGTPVKAFAQFNQFASVAKRRLQDIKTPTLIVHPRDDDMASLGNAHYLQRRLGGIVDLTVLDDSYHMVTLDRQRHVVVERSVAFAKALAARLAEARTAPAEMHRTTAAE